MQVLGLCPYSPFTLLNTPKRYPYLPENQNFNTRSADPLVVGMLVSVRQTLLKTVRFAISGWQIDA